MIARIEHAALWVRDLDRVADFYVNNLGARAGELYSNQAKGFASRFLTFSSGARLEIMTRTGIDTRAAAESLGYAHLALAVGDEAAVDALAKAFRAAGVRIVDGPRRTGDGYYE
ncbi:MAG TPA: VOC family protein, partial [Steroidobacteraceae bacterium]|nr:VOC family protein [Steroidobacteraceae bacterium]